MFFETDGLQIYYKVHGSGEPLLWLHGFSGSGADWKHVFPEPPAGFQLIAPDLRGHGCSAQPAGAYLHRDSAQDMLALLDHLSIARVNVIGLSGGGIVALHLATAAPERTAAMVLVSAPPSFPEQARAIQRAYSPAMLSEREMELLRGRQPRGDAQIEWLFEQVHRFADSTDDVHFESADLARITAETLIVFGDRDPLYPVSMACEMRQAIPRSYLWVIPNGGHGPIFGPAAPQFITTAMAFLRGEWRKTLT
jgi:pimeloyl-ACP methyl ester carboxylesterase